METNLPSDNIQAEFNEKKRLLDEAKAKLEEQMKAAGFTDEDAYVTALKSPAPAPTATPQAPNPTLQTPAGSKIDNTPTPDYDSINKNESPERKAYRLCAEAGKKYYELQREIAEKASGWKKTKTFLVGSGKETPEVTKAKDEYQTAKANYFNKYVSEGQNEYYVGSVEERKTKLREQALSHLGIIDSEVATEEAKEKLSDRKKSILAKTVGVVASGLETYRKIGDLGPGIAIGKKGEGLFHAKFVKSVDDQRSQDALYTLTLGKIGRSALLGFISGGTTFAGNLAWNVGRRAFNMTVLGGLSGILNKEFSDIEKKVFDSYDKSYDNYKNSLINENGSIESYLQSQEIAREKEERARRLARNIRASMVLLTAGLGYGLNAVENSDYLSPLSGKVHTDTPEKSGGTQDNKTITKDGKITKNTPAASPKPEAVKTTTATTTSSTSSANPASAPADPATPAAPAPDAKPSEWTAPKAPELDQDDLPEGAVIGEGNVSIIHAFKTQLEGDQTLAEHFKYPSDGTPAQKAAFLTNLAKKFGYIGEHGESVGVKAGMGEAFVLRAVEHDGEYVQFADEYQTVDGTTTLMQTQAENTAFDPSQHAAYEYTHTGAHAPVAETNPEPENPDEQPQPTGDKPHETERPHGGARPKLGNRNPLENQNPRPDGNSLLDRFINHADEQPQSHEIHEYHRGGYHDGERYNPEMDTNPHYLTESERASFIERHIYEQNRLAHIAIAGQSFGRLHWEVWAKIKDTSITDILNKEKFPKWWQSDPHHLRRAVRAIRHMVKDSPVRPNENEKVEDFVKRLSVANAQKELEVFTSQSE